MYLLHTEISHFILICICSCFLYIYLRFFFSFFFLQWLTREQHHRDIRDGFPTFDKTSHSVSTCLINLNKRRVNETRKWTKQNNNQQNKNNTQNEKTFSCYCAYLVKRNKHWINERKPKNIWKFKIISVNGSKQKYKKKKN